MRLDHLLSKEHLEKLRFLIESQYQERMFPGWLAHGWIIALLAAYIFSSSTTSLRELGTKSQSKLLLHAVGSLGIGKPKTKDYLNPLRGILWSGLSLEIPNGMKDLIPPVL